MRHATAQNRLANVGEVGLGGDCWGGRCKKGRYMSAVKLETETFSFICSGRTLQIVDVLIKIIEANHIERQPDRPTGSSQLNRS